MFIALRISPPAGLNLSTQLKFIVIVYLALSFISVTSQAASEINLTRSRLIQLAHSIETADSGRKYDFLHIALEQMYNAYAVEAEKASGNIPDNAKKRAKVFRWQFSSYRYLDSIESAIVLLDGQENPDFFISPQNKIIVLFNDQPPVIITGPNNGANKLIEKNIVDEFCLLYDCVDYFKKTEQQAIKQNNTPDTELTGSWMIKRNFKGAFVSDAGITFNFDNLKKRHDKEQWMNSVYQELLLILGSLKNAKTRSYAINWQILTLRPLPVTDNASKLIINSEQHFLKVNTPLLVTRPELFAQLKNWLKARFNHNKPLPAIIEHSEHYFKQR